MHRSKRSNLRKRTLKVKIQLFVLAKNLTKQLILDAKSIFKFGVRDVPRRLAHEAKAGEVACLALGPLILLRAGGVVAGEVEVTEDSTCSGHHLLKLLLLLLLLVPEAALLLVIVFVTGVVPVVVLVLIGGVKLLPLGALGDEVGGVTALEAAPRRPPPLLAEPMQSLELSRQQGDLIVGDALVLLIRSCTQGRQSKL
jgi:hypothetical protein